MPIYEYELRKGPGCDYCRNSFEIQQSIKDKPLTKCPECGSDVEKIISSFSIGHKNLLTSSNLREHGFTRLKKLDKGKYLKEGFGGE